MLPGTNGSSGSLCRGLHSDPELSVLIGSNRPEAAFQEHVDYLTEVLQFATLPPSRRAGCEAFGFSSP